MTFPEPTIRVAVDPFNPGQYFACCGLLELADRLWPGAEGWFADDAREFRIAAAGGLGRLVEAIVGAALIQLDPDDGTSSPILVGEPFRPLLLDWWHDAAAGGKELKVWAGSMESFGIARAMQKALLGPEFRSGSLFDIGMVVRDADNPAKKKEPYYFDARRAPNSHSRDIGFSPNDLQLTTTAYPAVEFLCLAGLQRCLPRRAKEPRVFDYWTWTAPAAPALLPALAAGQCRIGGSGFRFENWFRTGQRKHKAFRPAVSLLEGA